MNEYTFRVPIRPKVKERPRIRKDGRRYTPKTTSVYEAAVAECYTGPRFEGPVEISILLQKDSSTVTIRESDHKPSPLRGDIDNYMKAIMDALNGVAYVDDRQVLVVRAVKGI